MRCKMRVKSLPCVRGGFGDCLKTCHCEPVRTLAWQSVPLQCYDFAHPPTNGTPFPSRRRGGACLSRAGWRGDSGAFGRNGRDFPFGRRCGIQRQVSGQASPSPTAKAEPFFPLAEMRAGRITHTKRDCRFPFAAVPRFLIARADTNRNGIRTDRSLRPWASGSGH